MKMNLRNGYGISFNEWVLDNDIKNELRLLLIISSLSANKGFCNATNTYFSELFDETEESISRKINKLIKKGYLKAEYVKTGTIVNSRLLRLIKLSTAVDKNVKEINNKERNNIINNIISKESNFKKPTIEEIKQYCVERKNGISAEYFYDFYESKNWMIGKNKMKDWKAAIRTWERNNKGISKEKNKKIVPEWFDKEIEHTDIEQESDSEFKEFIEEFRK